MEQFNVRTVHVNGEVKCSKTKWISSRYELARDAVNKKVSRVKYAGYRCIDGYRSNGFSLAKVQLVYFETLIHFLSRRRYFSLILCFALFLRPWNIQVVAVINKWVSHCECKVKWNENWRLKSNQRMHDKMKNSREERSQMINFIDELWWIPTDFVAHWWALNFVACRVAIVQAVVDIALLLI